MTEDSLILIGYINKPPPYDSGSSLLVSGKLWIYNFFFIYDIVVDFCKFLDTHFSFINDIIVENTRKFHS